MKTALGRGLDALIPEKGLEVVYLDIKKISPNKKQPRKTFKEASLKELALSIKEKGVIQPITVARNIDGSFLLIAGERRWRAASLAGLEKVPAIIRKTNERDSLETALIENIQRDDLNPLELAEAFQELMTMYKLTQEVLADKMGKERATVANYLRLLKLPEEIKRLLKEEKLTMGHAKTLLAIEDRQRQIELAQAIVANGLSVRTTEEITKKHLKSKSYKNKKVADDPHIKDIEDRLRQRLGTKVKIHHKNKKGKIEIEYYSLDELDRLLEILT